MIATLFSKFIQFPYDIVFFSSATPLGLVSNIILNRCVDPNDYQLIYNWSGGLRRGYFGDANHIYLRPLGPEFGQRMRGGLFIPR